MERLTGCAAKEGVIDRATTAENLRLLFDGPEQLNIKEIEELESSEHLLVSSCRGVDGRGVFWRRGHVELRIYEYSGLVAPPENRGK